jgi:hypothetical protein
MSKSTYPRLAKADGVSLNQFIAAAVAEKMGVIETAREFCPSVIAEHWRTNHNPLTSRHK